MREDAELDNSQNTKTENPFNGDKKLIFDSLDPKLEELNQINQLSKAIPEVMIL